MQAASIVDVIQSMNSISPGLSLLHGAVCSGNPKMVRLVSLLSSRERYVRWAACKAHALSPDQDAGMAAESLS